MGVVCYLDPLGSGNSDPYKREQVLYELGNPSATTTSAAIKVPKPGVYKLWLVAAAIRQIGVILAVTIPVRLPDLSARCILTPSVIYVL